MFLLVIDSHLKYRINYGVWSVWLGRVYGSTGAYDSGGNYVMPRRCLIPFQASTITPVQNKQFFGETKVVIRASDPAPRATIWRPMPGNENDAWRSQASNYLFSDPDRELRTSFRLPDLTVRILEGYALNTRGKGIFIELLRHDRTWKFSCEIRRDEFG